MSAQLDRVDQWRIVIALVSLVVCASLIVVAAHDDASVSQAQSLNGDILGQDNDESSDHYVARADESLRQAPQDAPVFALITLATPLTPQEVAPLLRDIPRVNALVMGTVRPLAVPEPTGTEDRADVMSRYIGYASGLLQESDHSTSDLRITALVMYAPGNQLRELKDVPQVYAVETLPQGAQWNSFGVQPVRVPQ